MDDDAAMMAALLTLTGWLCFAGDARAPDVDASDAGASDAGPFAGPPRDGPARDGRALDGPARDGSALDANTAVTLPAAVPPPPVLHHLEGRVLARGGRRPVVGATIVVDVTAVEDTDAKGHFSADVPCGKRHIAVQAPRFDVALVERDVCIDPSPLVVRLEPLAGGAGYETVVRAPPPQQQMRLEGGELLRTPGTMGDPFRAVESLPGVAAVAWPAPIYAVRGANPGNTGFMLDDLRVPALFHLALGPSVIHPYFFERLDFYPGGYPARYGRSVAGLVSAQTRAAPDDDVHASVDVRLLDAGGMVTAPLPGNGAIAIAGRYSYLGPVVGLLSSDVSLGYWDYQLRADRQVGAYKLTLLAFGSGDHFWLRNNDPAAAMQGSLVLRFHRVKVRAERPLGGGRLVASLGGGLDHSEAPLYDLVPFVVDSASLLPRLAFLRPTRHADFELGLDGELTHYEPFSRLGRIGALDLTKPRTAGLLAAYASAAVRVAAPLVVTPELRLDTYSIGGTQKADLGPRLSGRLDLDGKTWLTATGGRFTQPPTFPLQIPGFENFGLALFGLQTSWQSSLGVGTTRLLGLETSLTGYLQRYVLTDIRDPTLGRSLDPLASDFLTRRDALSYGAEVLVRRPASERLHGWLSYTLSRNLRALGAGVIAPSDWDQRHILNLVLGYSLGRWTLGGRAHYNTGRPVLVSGGQGTDLGRLPAYYQIDLRVDRRFVFDKLTLEAYVELVNATLSRQTFDLTNPGLGAPMPGDSYRIVLPSIGVHGEI